MSVSRPSVHPVEVTSFAEATAVVNDVGGGNNNEDNGQQQNLEALHQDEMLVAQRVRMKDVEGMPGTRGGLILRLLQFAFAICSLCLMSTTPDFNSVTSFRYLVAAVSLQSLWSLVLAFVDVYALLVRRSLRNRVVACLFTVGDGVSSTLTFAAACASAGITVLIGNDFNNCSQNHCGKFEMATAMAFLSWFAVSPSFLFNFWTMASR